MENTICSTLIAVYCFVGNWVDEPQEVSPTKAPEKVVISDSDIDFVTPKPSDKVVMSFPALTPYDSSTELR